MAAKSLDPDKFLEAHVNLPGISHNPAGHVLGIIGLGRIGLSIARKAKACFEMKIVYNDIFRASSKIEDSLDAEYFEKLEAMLGIADCIVLATPYEGKILLHASHFFNMKKGARFVNVARGKLIDESGLINALEEQHLSAAGLDVHFDEPYVNSKLASMWNVDMHCHTAGGTIESHMGFERLGMENILSFHKTGVAITPVNQAG